MDSWRRTWWSVWTANFVTSIGIQSFLPFFPSLLEDLGLHDRAEVAVWAGVLYGAAPLSAAIMSPLWGSLGDRYGRKLMVLRSLAAITVFVGLMAFATTPWQLLVLRLLQGMFSGFIAPSATLVSIAAPAGTQGRIAGSLQTAMAAGSVVGPLVGGFAATHAGVGSVFLGVSAASTVAFALVLAFAREDATQRRQVDGKASLRQAVRDARRDFGDLWANPRLRAGLSIVFWAAFALGATSPILELHVRDLVSGSTEDAALMTSLLFSASALVNLLAMPAWGRHGDSVGHGRALVRSALASSIALAIQAVPVYGVLLVARVLFGAALAGSAACSFGLAAAETPVERRGGAFGIVFSARTLAAAIAAPLGGWLAGRMGVAGVLLACAAALAWSARGLRGGPSAGQRLPNARSAAGG
ncbi:MAG: MFS transporter [Planctomycetota bacterium]|nr:MFS transporter [Planctomycetota bacterium]